MPWTRVCAAEELPDGAMIEHGELDDAVMVAAPAARCSPSRGRARTRSARSPRARCSTARSSATATARCSTYAPARPWSGPALESLRTYPVRELDGAVEVEL